MFVRAKVSDKSDRELEDLRVNFSRVLKYRRWVNRSGSDKTVLYFDDKTELIIDKTVEEIDSELKACNYLMA